MHVPGEIVFSTYGGVVPRLKHHHSKTMAAIGSSSRRKSKVRRRNHLLDCGLRGAIVLALLLFALGMYTWGIAVAPVFSTGFSPMRWEISGSKANATGDAIGFGLREATVDITTKGLYDSIAFENKDGGAWRQGWEVQYRGDEWNEEQLKVLVVPHSHNDPGWIRTVEEYYQERTRGILSTIVRALVKDKRRKFIWEEVSYLQRWWQDASRSEKNDFVRLVKNGQLEIVGGGWVMNDEANSHYFAIIEQMVAGNIWLLDTIGATPKNAWAIDPFGHSSTMAYLLRRMGFQNMVIQRTHYEVKKVLAWEQNLEFMWRQTWDSANTTDIFCHMMPFYSYDIPHTCGPEPAVCCQFDYWRLGRVGGAQRCPWGYNPEEITPDNVRERAMLLLDQYKKKSTLYKSNTLLVPLGDDFRYTTQLEAELQYSNYQALFDYINAHSELKANVRFGTLEDYFSTLKAEVSRKPSLGKAYIHQVPGFPSLSGDFFTYADRVQDYWSGYYVSRPFYKAIDRVLEETLRAANILFFFSHAHCQAKEEAAFPLTHSEIIVSASRNLALFQHHDGVTGTAKDHVVEDYGMRMHSSLVELQAFMAASVEVLLSKHNKNEGCRKHTNLFEPEQTRSKFNVLPIKKSVHLTDGEVRRIVFFNALEEAVEQVVTIVVDNPSICVFNSGWTSLDSQLSPEWVHHSDNMFDGRHRLQWAALIPAMGLGTYFVTTPDESGFCKKASFARLRIFNSPESFACPQSYSCTFETVETVEISNEYQTLGFDSSSGLLRWARSHKHSDLIAVEEDLCVYSTQGSGAYLFLPDGDARSLVEDGGLVLVTEGLVMQEVHVVPKSKLGGRPIARSARLFRGKSVQATAVEMLYHVELLDGRYNNKELIARFKTGINNGKVFHSDLNGFQTIRRETYEKIPLQGNYYPMPSLAFLQDPKGRRFSVHSRQAVGVASLENGWLEMMLDRRLTHDDGRGLGQGVMDNRPISVGFHLLLEHNISAASAAPSASVSRVPSLLSHRVGAQLNYPLHAFLGKVEAAFSLKGGLRSGRFDQATEWSPLDAAFPCDLHVVSVQTLRPQLVEASSKGKGLEQYGLILQRRGWDDSYCRKGGTSCKTLGNTSLNVSGVFKNLDVKKVTLSTLNFLQDTEVENFEKWNRKSRIATSSSTRHGLVELDPMEIQAYKFSAEPSG